ncbi:restriction endonuclease subunit S [Nocardioides sp.]|uniref:restriction endonuclease subunit S n=1 Tax=Nocardioides sp. TaxID=35761 RepID=UPI00260C5024|nr:restriction endonuclease subunit S [Nocardioides sp.]
MTRAKRETNLEWLETVPEHWSEREVGREVWVRARLGWKGLTANEYVETGVPMLATPDIKGPEIAYTAANKITVERYDESPDIQLRAGDVLLTKDGNTIGTVNVVRELPGLATVNGSIAVLTPKHGLDGRFLYWFIASSYAQSMFDRLRGGMGVPHLFQRDINRIRFPYPPVAEQRAIADYLDQVTARIDTLIQEQHRLIALLREKRKALLDIDLRPSETWRQLQIKHLGDTSLGKMLDAGRAVRDGDSLRPYVRAADVRADGSINLTDLNEMPFSDAEMERFDLRAGDVLLIEGGATVGRPGYLPADAAGVAFQKTVNRLRVGPLADPRFIYWSMLRLYESGFYPNHYGSVSFVHLTGEKLRQIRLDLPDVDEQRRIAARLDEQTAKIDETITQTERFIELSKERRAALITAAVTGQIDVRDDVA